MTTKTILLVDDSSTIRRIVELSFHDSPIRVETVEAGAEVVERIERGDAELVLADTSSPEPSGYELCRRIKACARPVPVVLLAGAFEPFDRDRVRSCGADDCLVKPFEADLLRDKVGYLLSRPAVGPVGDAPAPPEGEPAPEVAEVERAAEPDAGPPVVPVEQEAAPSPPAPVDVSPQLVDAVARVVLERMTDDVVRSIARELVPELAARIIRERIRELEAEEP